MSPGPSAGLVGDTGSRGALTVMQPFAVSNGLIDKYHAIRSATVGYGVGGPSKALLARAPVSLPAIVITGLDIEPPARASALLRKDELSPERLEFAIRRASRDRA